MHFAGLEDGTAAASTVYVPTGAEQLEKILLGVCERRESYKRLIRYNEDICSIFMEPSTLNC